MVISLNGIKKNTPVCFEELKTRQYELLVPELAKEIEQRDHFKMFNIISESNFSSFEGNTEMEVTIWNAIKWIYEQPFPVNEFPKVLKYKGQLISIPAKVKALSIGQNIALKKLIINSKYEEENLSAAVAIYLQPIIDGKKFNSDRVEIIKKEIEQMPVTLIRPIGFFLLKNASTLGNGQTNFLRRTLNSLIRNSVKHWLISHRSKGLIGLAT